MSIRRRPVLITALAVGIGGAVVLGAWQPWRKPVPTITVERRTLREQVEVSGSVEAARAVTVKAETTGAIEALRAPENRPVAKGAPLLTLDAAQARLQLDQARANAEAAVAQARTQLRNAQAVALESARRERVTLNNLAARVDKAASALRFLEGEVARNEGLLGDGAISAQQVEQQRQQLTQARLDLTLAREELARARSGQERVQSTNAVMQARTQLATAERQGAANVKLAAKALADTTIEAPFAGTVTDWLVDPGAWVTPGTPLAQFQDLAHLRLRLPVDELDLPKLQPGGGVTITFDAYPDDPIQGRIAAVSRASVTGTGNVQVFPVDVAFSDPQGRIRPGMSGDAQILVREIKDVLAVPIGAIKRTQDTYQVMRVNGGKSEPRAIKPGISTLEYVEVREGLSAGEQIEYVGASPAPKP